MPAFIRSGFLARYTSLLIVLLAALTSAIAQSSRMQNGSFARVNIPRLTQTPTLQDFADMEAASAVARQMLRIDGFVARLPVDDVPSSELTEVYLGYDHVNLYAVFLCFDSHPEKMRVRRPSRDAIFDDDSVTIQFDTFHDQQRAFGFGVNAGGIQGDGIWVEGQGWDLNFDTVYRTEVKRTLRGYIAFFAIPFRSLRFPSAPTQEWGVLLNRTIARIGEQTFWPRYSQRVQGRTNQMGTLTGLAEVSSGKNLQVVPYLASARSKLLEANVGSPSIFKQRDAEIHGGMDLKSVWHDQLTFDLTVNPDFRQVESDAPQILVNQRFEAFFPEKRLFFLENSSYFQTPIQLLFTRRIAKPDAGARLTGKLGRYGIGLLFADDRAPGAELPLSDPNSGKRAFTGAVRITRDLRAQTYVGGSLVQHQFAGQENAVLGADTMIKLGENWRTIGQFVASRSKAQSAPDSWGEAVYGGLFEDGQHWITHLEYNDRSPGFRSDAGFVPRVAYRGITNLLQYNFRPAHRHLVRWGPLLTTSAIGDYSGQLTDWAVGPGLQLELKKSTVLEFSCQSGGLGLRPVDFITLTRTRAYQVRDVGGRISSIPFNSLSFDLSARAGRTVNFSPPAGKPPVSVRSFAGEATIGLRPSAGLTIDTTYLFSDLGDEMSGRTVLNDHILRSRWLYQIDQRWSVRLIAQYNSLVVNPALTSLQKIKQINGDVLVGYRVNPATAFFVGYNYDVQNYDPRAIGSLPPLARGTGLLNDGRVLFAKLSYLFRY